MINGRYKQYCKLSIIPISSFIASIDLVVLFEIILTYFFLSKTHEDTSPVTLRETFGNSDLKWALNCKPETESVLSRIFIFGRI